MRIMCVLAPESLQQCVAIAQKWSPLTSNPAYSFTVVFMFKSIMMIWNKKMFSFLCVPYIYWNLKNQCWIISHHQKCVCLIFDATYSVAIHIWLEACSCSSQRKIKQFCDLSRLVLQYCLSTFRGPVYECLNSLPQMFIFCW